MIFLTVGSMFPFDRLVQAVDDMIARQLITETVVAQIGENLHLSEPLLRLERHRSDVH